MSTFDDDMFADLSGSMGGLEELLEHMSNGWVDLGDAVLLLTEEELCRPGTMGDWSIKDVMAHFVAWETEAARRVELIANGMGGGLQWPTREDENEFNAAAVEAWAGKSVEEIIRMLEDSHQDLMDMLVAYGDDLVLASIDPPASDWLAGWTSLHYQEHAALIRAWKSAN